jgi:LmbE family N-acetylglucosaminyl deacetylase
MLAGRRPLILAPHADDESLGCGGLIAGACAIGLAPIVVILTDGTKSHPDSLAFPPPRLRLLREAEALKAVKLLGLSEKNLFFLRYEDTRLPAAGDGFLAAIAWILAIARERHCGLVIGPWAGDPHCDHEAGACIAGAVAARAGVNLLSYPVWGWLRNGADRLAETRNSGWRLEISDYLERKQAAIAAHESQYGDLITDSPRGFRLPKNLLAIFARPYEVFIA